MGRRTANSRRPSGGEWAARWAEDRLGTRGVARKAMRKAFPSHWSFVLGEISLYSFVVLVITGTYLALYFHPSTSQVEYHGSYRPLQGQHVSEAFNSTMHISFEVRGGLLVRQAHHWAALVFIASILAHLMRVFFTGAFRKPRELNWLLGFALLVLGMFAGLTGYDLPDDLLSGTGLMIVHGTLLSVPVVGTYLSMLLFGGEFPGGDVIARFDIIHVLLIPALMVGIIAVHLVLAVRHKPAQYPGPGRENGNVVGLPFRTYAVKAVGLFFLTSGVIFLVASIAQINPVWLYGPYRADQVSAGSQPDWYMGVADGLLRVMPGWELTAWGHTLALDNLVPLGAGVVFFAFLGAYPFIESWVTDDDTEHHLLDRPRNRPVRVGIGAAWISVYLVALAGAGNDLLATHLHLSVNAVTWAVRVGLFAVPAVAYTVAKRCALGLQRQDREKVLHGRETGVLRRLPHGEFIDVHETLSQKQLHLLTSHEQYRPIDVDPTHRTSGVLRLRARISRVFHGDSAQVPKVTPREYREISEGHGK
ncbi:cytochrome bc1 complex cytochrome b subunit [Actinacidiphila rubida]